MGGGKRGGGRFSISSLWTKFYGLNRTEKSYRSVLSRGNLMSTIVCKIVLTFESVDEILKCDH